jgi:hypothetical protein
MSMTLIYNKQTYSRLKTIAFQDLGFNIYSNTEPSTKCLLLSSCNDTLSTGTDHLQYITSLVIDGLVWTCLFLDSDTDCKQTNTATT